MDGQRRIETGETFTRAELTKLGLRRMDENDPSLYSKGDEGYIVFPVDEGISDSRVKVMGVFDMNNQRK